MKQYLKIHKNKTVHVQWKHLEGFIYTNFMALNLYNNKHCIGIYYECR